MTDTIFDTQLVLAGPLRTPRQMLSDQVYDSHLSLHDDATAENLGFSGAPIEGPTHFSQLVPLLYRIFGPAWFETGCLSAHYQNVCVEGDQVRAFVEQPEPGQTQVKAWIEKSDGTPVLTATASIGSDHPESELERRIANLRPVDKLVIIRDLKVGMKGAAIENVSMDFDQNMGDLYPFSLNQKLTEITENCPWYSEEGGKTSPWGRGIIPLEMISVLTQYSSRESGFPARGPAVGLFADQEIKMIKGPLFVGQAYTLEREIIALSESRRTESSWVKSTVRDEESGEIVAEAILNNATLKESYAKYEEELKALS